MHCSSPSCTLVLSLSSSTFPNIPHSIAIPWFTIREVPVEITTPSPRVAVIKFKKGIQQGLLGRISRSATMEYHGFGIISEGIESETHYMIAGVQGDWTRDLVTDPPKFLYSREMKVGSTSSDLHVRADLSLFSVRWSTLPRPPLPPRHLHLHWLRHWRRSLHLRSA